MYVYDRPVNLPAQWFPKHRTGLFCSFCQPSISYSSPTNQPKISFEISTEPAWSDSPLYHLLAWPVATQGWAKYKKKSRCQLWTTVLDQPIFIAPPIRTEALFLWKVICFQLLNRISSARNAAFATLADGTGFVSTITGRWELRYLAKISWKA